MRAKPTQTTPAPRPPITVTDREWERWVLETELKITDEELNDMANRDHNQTN